MVTVKIKGCEIGKGKPKICIPIIGRTRKDILSALQGLKDYPYSIAEWRADYFESLNVSEITGMLGELREQLPDKVLLFTLRTKLEGGQRDVSADEYFAVNKAVIESKFADIVDIELNTEELKLKTLIHIANKADTKVIMSYHDFEGTPGASSIIKKLCLMQELGADITKIATMPKTQKDVVSVLEAMVEMSECYADKPFVAISMSGQGFLTRLAGEVFGSAITYGSYKAASAPGQIDAKTLDDMLNIVSRQLKG